MVVKPVNEVGQYIYNMKGKVDCHKQKILVYRIISGKYW